MTQSEIRYFSTRQSYSRHKPFHPLIGFLRWAIARFLGKHVTTWSEPYNEEPSVFVGFHAQAYGPAVMCSCFPLAETIRPWVNAPMCFVRQVPAYARKDFWWPQDRWYTKILDYTLPYLAAPISALAMHEAEGIPVYHDMRMVETFRKSVESLQEGRNILIFPQKPQGYLEYGAEISRGFILLAQKYYRKTGKALQFYPVVADKSQKTIQVAAPIRYNPQRSFAEEETRLIRYISEALESLRNNQTSD